MLLTLAGCSLLEQEPCKECLNDDDHHGLLSEGKHHLRVHWIQSLNYPDTYMNIILRSVLLNPVLFDTPQTLNLWIGAY